jgi:hypothetical protein
MQAEFGHSNCLVQYRDARARQGEVRKRSVTELHGSSLSSKGGIWILEVSALYSQKQQRNSVVS